MPATLFVSTVLVLSAMEISSSAEPFLASRACQRCVLQGSNFRSARDNKVWELCLTPTALESTGDNNRTLLLRLGDVIGAKATPAAVHGALQDGAEGDGSWVHRLEVFAYVPGGNSTEREIGCAAGGGLCRKKKRKAAHQTWLVSDADTAINWATAINDGLRGGGLSLSVGKEGVGEDGDGDGDGDDVGRRESGSGRRRQRRLLVLINPVSGTGGSRSIWQETLRPMLEQAQATTTVIFSTRRGEFTETIANAGGGGGGGGGGGRSHGDASTSSAVEGASVVGGGERARGTDGSRVGMIRLDDFDGIVVVGGDGTFFEVLQGMYARADCATQLKRLSLGLVPSGTGNGLAKTVSVESGEEFGAVGASFLAAKGHTREMDLLPTESGDKKYLAFLNVGWGMISDVDIESEAYRWMGSLRFTVGTAVRIINLKHYRGRISFLPALDDADRDPHTAGSSPSNGGIKDEVGTAPRLPFRMPPLTEALHFAEVDSDSGSGAVRASVERWSSVEGEFVLADATQASHIAHDMPMAPHSRLGDGLIDLFFIKKGASRISMIKMFLAMEKGEHISPRYPCISWSRVRAFRIEPLTSKGRLTVDGELVDYAPLQQHVWPKAANVFCSPA